MPKRLQTDERTTGRTSAAVWSTELILNYDYCEYVTNKIKNAKSSINIHAYAWRWYKNEPEIDIQKLNTEIVKAVNRGCTVRAIINPDTCAQTLRSFGILTKKTMGVKTQHAKAISIDDKYLIIGSHNLTKKANTQNIEISCGISDFQVVDLFTTYFNSVWRTLNDC